MGKKVKSKKRKSSKRGWGDEAFDNHPDPEDLKEIVQNGEKRRPLMTQKRQEALRRRRRREQELKYDRQKTARFAKPKDDPRAQVIKPKRRRGHAKKKVRVVSESDTDPEDIPEPLTEAEAYASLLADLQERQTGGMSELATLLKSRQREQLGKDESTEESDEEEEEPQETKLTLTEEEFQSYQKEHAGKFTILEMPEGSEIDTGNANGIHLPDEEESAGDDMTQTDEVISEDDEEDYGSMESAYSKHFFKRVIEDTEQKKLVQSKKLRSVKTPGLLQFSTINGNQIPQSKTHLPSEDIKTMLRRNWKTMSGRKEFTSLQASLFSSIHNYWDLFFAAEDYLNIPELRQLYILHILNHTIQARNRVLKHNKLLRKKANDARSERKIQELDAAVEGKKLKHKEMTAEDIEQQEELEGKIKDQGYTRPKVLILLPMRNSAMKAIHMMLALLGPNTSVSNLERFNKEFGMDEEEEEEDPSSEKTQARKLIKPADWEATFGGNFDDDFKIGISITPGQGKGKGPGKGCALKLYSEFYHSDIIMASPLGLYLAIGPEGEAKRDFDFLSSLEVVVIDQADVMLMQNWSHVQAIMSLLNQIPKQDHNTDFSRIREYFLQDQAAFYRQTIMFSQFQDPLLLNLFNSSFRCIAGKIKAKSKSKNGSICRVALTVKQMFQRIECSSFEEQDDARFLYFSKVLLPKLLLMKEGHTLIFIPSYFDFVRVRNLFLQKEASFVSVHEYARKSEVSRSRAWFFHGKKDIMLYTGRTHHVQRLKIRGARHLIFYSVPEYGIFYPEIVNLLEEANGIGKVTTCLTMFSSYEKLALERVVGSKRCNHMLQSDKNTFLFY